MNRFLTAIRAAILLCIATLMSACAPAPESDYCSDHHLLHASHAGETGMLTIDIGRDNDVAGSVSWPATAISGGMQQGILSRLSESGGIMTIADDARCNRLSLSEQETGGSQSVEFSVTCDASVRMRQINITLLETIPEIEEFVVAVQTPATSKMFAISRRCPSPLFRITGETR